MSQIRSPVPGTGPLSLQQDLLLGLRDANANTVLSHCFLLQGYDALTSLDAVRTLQTSADIRLRTCGYDLLIRNGDMAVLPDIVRFIGSSSSQNVPLSDLSSALAKVRDVRAVPFLEKLSDASQLVVRLTAVETLRNIANSSAVPTLIHKLDDRNSMVRFQAVKGLAQITKKDPTFDPSMPEFDQNEARYLGFWKQWWTSEGKNQYQ